MNAKSSNSLFLATLLIVPLTLVGCSKSDSGPANGGTTLNPMVAVGTMTKGSVIVNGVIFEDNAARITGDDTNKVPADLQSGMTVKVKGSARADDTGTAERIEIENEVRGALTKTGADTFTVHGQPVLVDGGTIFANVADFAGLADNDNVEVHGQRMADAANTIRATRVEKLGAGAVDDEVRGTVSGLAGAFDLGQSFSIGTLSISTNATTSVTPGVSAIVNGALVEVHLNGAVATRIHAEDADVEFEPAEGEEFEVEGFVSGFTNLSSPFKVNNQTVQASSSTRFEGGVKSDLLNDMKVEAEGHLSGGILLANKIVFKEMVRLISNATATGSANLFGKTVLVPSKVDLSSNLTGSVANIIAGRGIEVRGFVNKKSDGSDDDSSITATRVVMQSGTANRDIIRGPVKNINAGAGTFTILGITIATGPSTIARPDDDNSNDNNALTMSLTTFLSSLSSNAATKTIVKARGTFDAATNTLTADEVEIE